MHTITPTNCIIRRRNGGRPIGFFFFATKKRGNLLCRAGGSPGNRLAECLAGTLTFRRCKPCKASYYTTTSNIGTTNSRNGH